MFSIKRIFISALLILCLSATAFIIYKAYRQGEWNTIASALAVVTAVLAIWSSLTLTWRQEDDKQPTINIFLDTKTHKRATSLKIENIGGGPAYFIKIEWTKPILDYEEKEVRFTDFSNDYDFNLLPPGKSYARFVGVTTKLFERYKGVNEPLLFDGNISYSRTKRNRRRVKEKFQVSLEPHAKTINSLNDQMDFYAENKEMAKRIKELNDTLKKIHDAQHRKNLPPIE